MNVAFTLASKVSANMIHLYTDFFARIDSDDTTSSSALFSFTWVRLMPALEKLGRNPDHGDNSRNREKVDNHVALFPLLLYLDVPTQLFPPSPNMLVHVVLRFLVPDVVKVWNLIPLFLLTRAKSTPFAVGFLTSMPGSLPILLCVGICVFGSLCAVTSIATGLVE